MGFSEPTFYAIGYAFLFVATILYIIHLIWGDEGLARLGKMASIASLLALTAGLSVRTIAIRLWPLASTYDFALGFVWGLILFHLVLERRMGMKAMGAFILPIAFLIATYALVLTPAEERVMGAPTPMLRSYIVPIHVTTAIVAYSSFAASCGAGLMYLIREAGFASRLPSLEEIDEFNSQAIAFGFPWMTGLIIMGMICAEDNWGTYWHWDPKEIWALITWLVYVLFFHARVIRGWKGRPMALLSIVGFLVVMSTFLGVRRLVRWMGLESLHMY